MTYIVRETQVDKQNRVNINGLYKQDQMPKEVVLVVDAEREAILILKASDATDFGITQKVDEKSRLIIPGWIMKNVGNNKDFFLTVEDGKRYLSPVTGDILPRS
ncbi:hypothetical protein IKF94_02195 [Candidatus Saccharibacteria bacterium]|nr:hypothetical protein [Candidatus Saccharibacteria bacterium]